MRPTPPHSFDRTPAVVVGAGIGGLAAAMRLQAAGHAVTLLERHGWVGGRMRAVPSAAGPIDAGPTVLTMRPVFEDLFAACDARLADHVSLTRQDILARHYWTDGSSLDLHAQMAASARAVETFAGADARGAFERFWQECRALFDLFEDPMMKTPEPSVLHLAAQALSVPRLLPTLAPRATMSRHLARRFDDPRLRQLFGRYATYVGGAPDAAPALLCLIWEAEARGVWRVEGGMQALARAMADRFAEMGGIIRLNAPVGTIDSAGGVVAGVTLESGTQIPAHTVIFNGDPRALPMGLLGADVRGIARQSRRAPRSHSARVLTFAARVTGPELAHHTVFFAPNARSEFRDLKAGRMPRDPSIYICAEDRGGDSPAPELERFEIILNAPPLTTAQPQPEEAQTCLTRTFQALARFGLHFDPIPEPGSLTTPHGFETLFPGSAGSLYGQSPHGMTAALQRPRARTSIRGLYLVGGGTHPGAGVPMAALSGRHAVEAIVQDHALT